MFKKKVSAEVISAALFKSLESRSGMERAERSLPDYLSESDKANVRLELKLLEIAAIDFGVFQTLGDSLERKAILEAFYGFLRNESERFFGCPASAIAPKLIDRLSKYAIALKTPHEMGGFYMIGKTFSEFCGREDAILAYIASVVFSTRLMHLPLKQILKDYKIEI